MPNARSRFSTDSTRHVLSVIGGYGFFFVLFFSPVVLSKYTLAPGDGISYFLPNFYSRAFLWDPSIWGGFPAVGDAQRMFWYPPALLLSYVPHAWDVFIISAYIFASSFTYGYVYSLTRSRLSAFISGLVYGLSGFMIAHLGHAAVVHTIAWLPLIVWSYSELASRERVDRPWFAIATLAITCAALAGHPQMFTYVLLISAAFAIVAGVNAKMPRLRYYVLCTAALIVGIGLAAVQLVPTLELTPQTLRAALTFQEFIAYQVPLRQLPMLVFPFLYGGAPASFYATPYFGAWPSSPDGWGANELTGYVGLLPLMLAALGFVSNRGRTIVWFWVAVAVIALLLVIGESTPLAFITYHLPVLNKFRAPARHFFGFAFAVSVLAGVGAASFLNGGITRRMLLRTVTIAAMVMVSFLLLLQIGSGKLNELATQHISRPISLNPIRNPSLIVPLLIFLFSVGALLLWRRQRISKVRVLLLVILLVVDLSSFAWFSEWRYRSPYAAYLRAPVAANDYKKQIDETHQRVMPVRGGLGRVAELPPDLSRLWQIPSATGYGPFVLTRLNRLFSMPPHGTIDDTWRDPANQGLDLLSVRYVLLPERERDALYQTDERGLQWSVRDYSDTIGQGCSPGGALSTAMDLQQPLQATRVGIVGTLACSVEIANGVEFAQVLTTNTSGQTSVHSLRAGEHFSEWAWDCSDVNAAIRHRRALVFSSRPAERGSIRCEAHDYVAFVPLEKPEEIKAISFRWTGPPATFALRKITVIDDNGRVSVPVPPVTTTITDNSRWRLAGKIESNNSGYGAEVKPDDVGVSHVFENLRARPRVWLVPEVVQVSDVEALNAIRTSILPDGRTLDLTRVALIEDASPPLGPSPNATTSNGTARVTSLTDSAMEIETSSSSNAFLVTSDTYYPGWTASIDGQLTNIYHTDYLIRGVAVPAGSHRVRFEFRPKSFYVGGALSVFSLLLLGLSFGLRRR